MQRFLVLLCGCIPLTGFAATTRHGDAVFVREHGFSFLPKPADHLDFPKTSLRKPGTYRYRVIGLPQVLYPTGFLLEVPQDEDESGVLREHPWTSSVIRASLVTSEGQVFFSRTYHLGRDRHGSSPGRHGRRAIFFLFIDSWRKKPSLPQHRSYVLQIEVLHPSSRASDTLTVDPYIPET